MSEYFSNFPRILYDIDGTNSVHPTYTTAINLLIRQKLRTAIEDDVVLYYPYQIKDTERPDVLSFNYYGHVRYTWLIFLVNNILDPQWDWPLDYKNFKSFLLRKYGSIDKPKGQIHHYEYIARPRVERTGTTDPVPEYTIEVDHEKYKSINEDLRKVVYVYDWEKDRNEKKREIQLVENTYASQILTEARRIFR